MDIPKLIRGVQAALNITVDGKAGPQTWSAISSRLVPEHVASSAKLGECHVDPASLKNINTLLPIVRPYAIALLHKARNNGIQLKIIGGLRTYEEQNALYAKGRTSVGAIVTQAKGGYSNHNFGLAFDIGIFEDGTYLGHSPKYKAAGVLGQDLGLDWGGNWKSFKDESHFQLRPLWALKMTEREMLAALRERKSAGAEFFV